ncbi:hypothetical protein GGD66_002442 [Bradyrhizobium sp. CIR48]|uniref:protein DpdD n=1 Tax=Bradyrhizobium sp. CIR48 TaxID=2663840 RepID=UPI001606BB90|nr:protein DpdD [Bradyrhizobium sp. CIR48]MBB4423898.1 hypothetical protein [Bradyrhizobium sp. CIR48]
MIEGLSPSDLAWLRTFFTAPNGVDWEALQNGFAPVAIANHIRPWLRKLATDPRAPICLPFVRGGKIAGWYATTQTAEGGLELGAELKAWLGPTYLSTFDVVPVKSNDAMAKAMRCLSGGMVYRFAGPDPESNERIAARIADYGETLKLRPLTVRQTVRPIGSIRADFDRALLAQDESRAELMIAELRGTGRLNEENMRYLDVRLKAGLGYWPQIARDHWLVSTMSDLALPPQVLADIIEALYRTYIEEVEPGGSLAQVLQAFELHIAGRYPRLFASRRGIRTPRIIKAFLLYESLQTRPDINILHNLSSLLPDTDREGVWAQALSSASEAPADTGISEANAEEAFDDAQYDRAFEFFLALPLSRKSVSRLLFCVSFIDTEDAKSRLLSVIDAAPAIVGDLAPAVRAKLETLRSSKSQTAAADERPISWMRWAKQIASGRDLEAAELQARDAVSRWDIAPFRENEKLSNAFAELIGGASGDAAVLVRRSVPDLMAAFFSEESTPTPALRSIANILFLFIAMEEVLSRTDLDLLAQLLGRLLEMGLSDADYQSLIGDLEDVQRRVGSYAHLPWSLDICEALAIAPSPSASAREARLRFFVQVLAQARGFSHRLRPQDLLPMEFLAKDYGIETATLDALRRSSETQEVASRPPDLAGKTLGIYTLSESAGSRAKDALQRMFPGCRVEVNSDLVCTPRLTNLAKASDMFVFAWKSSSHQAFYCVKDALPKGEPIWAVGKGTASILRAVLDNLD